MGIYVRGNTGSLETGLQGHLIMRFASLPAGYRIELGGSIEEATEANDALATIFPAMIQSFARLRVRCKYDDLGEGRIGQLRRHIPAACCLQSYVT